MFNAKISLAEKEEKTPYTLYYPHSRPVSERKWNQGYFQVVSIDPARKNYALRIERRYPGGHVETLVFDKREILDSLSTIKINLPLKQKIKGFSETTDGVTTMYENLTSYLNEYRKYFFESHFIFIERQLPINYKATRVAQHTISYFSLLLHDTSLLPVIIEVPPTLKTQLLDAPKGMNKNQTKTWSAEKSRETLTKRGDTFALQVMDYYFSKQDDLGDTVNQVDAMFKLWGNIEPEVASIENKPKLSLTIITSEEKEIDPLTQAKPVPASLVLRKLNINPK